MSKALLKGELDKEFRSLEEVDKKENKRKKQLKDLRKYVSTNKHGVKKSLKRLQAKNGNTNASKSSKKTATAGKYLQSIFVTNLKYSLFSTEILYIFCLQSHNLNF